VTININEDCVRIEGREREKERERESWMEKERGRGEREENLSSKAEKGTEREGGRERENRLFISCTLALWFTL
jgi:hypothetical protein